MFMSLLKGTYSVEQTRAAGKVIMTISTVESDNCSFAFLHRSSSLLFSGSWISQESKLFERCPLNVVEILEILVEFCKRAIHLYQFRF